MKPIRILITLLAGLVPAWAYAAVTLLSQPVNQIAIVGTSASLSVSAKSSSALRYSWYKNGSLISNKTRTLTFSKVTKANAGRYRCKVSDSSGAYANCKEITLTVVDPEPIPPTPVLSGVRITWDHPTTNVDGSALAVTQIAGYQVYRMAGPDPAASGAKIADTPPQLSWTVGDLVPGTYYFRLRTVTKSGLVSPNSQLLTQVLP